MQRIWRYIPKGLRDRPFDAYTALALIAVGIYGLVDPYFPEVPGSAISAVLFHVIEVYFILASSIMLLALSSEPKAHPSFYFFGQMYSWAFIFTAAISVMLIQLWQAHSVNFMINDPQLFLLIFFIFGCVGWAAFVRSFDMWLYVKRVERGNV